jgi:hypothetical protein
VITDTRKNNCACASCYLARQLWKFKATPEILTMQGSFALGGPTMFARIGVMKALNRGVERVFHRALA